MDSQTRLAAAQRADEKRRKRRLAMLGQAVLEEMRERCHVTPQHRTPLRDGLARDGFYKLADQARDLGLI